MNSNIDSQKLIKESITKLLAYCKQNKWAGFDPYDSLNSRIFRCTPFFKSRICRLILVQFMKRFPVNLRPLLLVPREQNPKAIALFLMAFLKLSRFGLLDRENLVGLMIERLIALRFTKHSLLVLGLQFPMADADNIGSSDGDEPCLYVFCRRRIARRIRDYS